MNEKFDYRELLRILLCLAMAITLFLMGLRHRLSKDVSEEVPQINIEKVQSLIGQYVLEGKSSPKLTDSLIRSILYSVNAYYPEVIMAQYELESCKGTSKVFNRTNNLFGMKKAFQRPTCRNVTNTVEGYAEYKNWQLSVLDRVLWDVFKWSEKPSKDEYMAALKKSYAEDPKYVEKLEVLAMNYK